MNIHIGETKNAIVPRATVEALVNQRDATLELYRTAWGDLTRANESVIAANTAWRKAVGANDENAFNYHVRDEKSHFLNALKFPGLDEYLKIARRLVDTDVWAYIIKITDLERLMDRKAKNDFHQQLIDNPPEVTVDNVYATLEGFVAQSGTIFKRGIAECFSSLDRRFRSHDGWKIGSRIILSYAFDSYGWWNYNRQHEANMIDVERVFRVLDGTLGSHFEIVNEINFNRRGHHGARRSEIETTYFKIRIFKNGNAHLWFKRDDLLERVNQLLGEYYGAPIPEDRDAEDDPLAQTKRKTAPAKFYGFFPTPDDVAQRLVGDAHLLRSKDEPQMTILEPSAGFGNIARLCIQKPSADMRYAKDYRWDNAVDCVEIQGALANELRSQRIFRKVYSTDFLVLKPTATGLYDRVIMNPPFDRERDIDHVMHALDFLKPDGFLCAIMSAGTEFRDTRKSNAFRELMQKMNARWTDLPAGSFSEAGTNCNTIILRVYKDGHSFWS